MKILECKNIKIGYKKHNNNGCVLSNINFELIKGELVGLVGRNGSGKSTLIKTIIGLIPLLDGDVLINSKSIKNYSEEELSKLISVVLTDKITNTYFTAFDIVAFGRYPYLNRLGKLTLDDKKIIFDSLEKVGMLGYKNKTIDSMSDGEKQRVMIAKALAQDTPIVLLDEPTAHLDLPNKIEIFQLLKKLTAVSGKSIIVSSHDLNLVLNICDKLCIINNGITVGIPEELVLSNHISNTFSSKHIKFDKSSGNFIMTSDPTRNISYDYKGISGFWVQKALIRIGYSISNKSNLELISENGVFTLLKDNVLLISIYNLKDLLKFLKNYTK